MKIAVRGGHNYGVPGANGFVNEVVVDRLYYKALIAYLIMLGHQVLDVTPDHTDTSAQDLTFGVSKANAWGAELFISCHVNAGGGHGCEVLYLSASGKAYAEKVVTGISALGFTNRGAKADVRGLYELKRTNMPAIIVEPFFCDTQSDVTLYNNVGYDRLGQAIAEAVSGKAVKPSDTSVNIPVDKPVDNSVKPVVPVPKPVDKSDSFVKSLQDELNKQGFTDDSGKKLVVDGIAGARTYQACAKAVIKKGAKGNLTKLIQGKVGAVVDGDFGAKTDLKVKAWQKAHKLVQDGIVGLNTWKSFM